MTLNEARIAKNKQPEINEMHCAILFILPVEETAQNDFRNRLIMRLNNNESLEEIAVTWWVLPFTLSTVRHTPLWLRLWSGFKADEICDSMVISRFDPFFTLFIIFPVVSIIPVNMPQISPTKCIYCNKMYIFAPRFAIKPLFFTKRRYLNAYY